MGSTRIARRAGMTVANTCVAEAPSAKRTASSRARRATA
jgi:hypothetical protein